MTEQTNAGKTEPQSLEIARTWYFDLLRRELEQRGQGESAVHLPQQLRLTLEREEQRPDGSTLYLKLAHRLTEYETRLNAVSGETISWYIDFLSIEGDQSMSPNEALKLAEAVAQPPEGAQLELSGYETVADRTVFRARWEHVHDNLPVEGDFIEVLINGKNRHAFSYTKVWRQPNLSETYEER
jgi:hypothetical protein